MPAAPQPNKPKVITLNLPKLNMSAYKPDLAAARRALGLASQETPHVMRNTR